MLALFLIVAPLAADDRVRKPAPVDPALKEVLERFDRVQDSIRTLSSEFTWTTDSTLLKNPMVSEGKFYLTKPRAIRWDFTSPEPMEFVIAHDEYIGYFPWSSFPRKGGPGRKSRTCGSGSAKLPAFRSRWYPPILPAAAGSSSSATHG
jgi:hypothetical protein